jgi:DNA-binding CsgD family transcriptional regulator
MVSVSNAARRLQRVATPGGLDDRTKTSLLPLDHRAPMSAARARQARLGRARLALNPASDVSVRLTPRQLECLRRITAGQRTAEIAGALGLSPRTIDHYVRETCIRLQVRSRAEAVAKAIGLGLIHPPTPAPTAI